MSGVLFSEDSFRSTTLKANETITVVFTRGKDGLYVHLEFKDANGKLIEKTEKKEWRLPIFPLDFLAYQLSLLQKDLSYIVVSDDETKK